MTTRDMRHLITPEEKQGEILGIPVTGAPIFLTEPDTDENHEARLASMEEWIEKWHPAVQSALTEFRFRYRVDPTALRLHADGGTLHAEGLELAFTVSGKPLAS